MSTADSETERRFLQLSLVLSGLNRLDAATTRARLDVAKAQLGAKLDDLLNKFAAIEDSGDLVAAVRKEIMLDPVLGPSAKLILILWYVGGVQDKDWRFQSADAYYGGLVWEAVGAHPPGLSNAYYGHWKYPPET